MTKSLFNFFLLIFPGDMTIGSSPSCGVTLCGSGILPLHCTLYRSETNQVTLVPEPEAKTLIDGNKITEETTLSQGKSLIQFLKLKENPPKII